MAGPTDQDKAKTFAMYTGGVAAVLIALAVMIGVMKSGSGEESPSDTATSTTATATTESLPTTTVAEVFPADRVAYIASDGTVLSGSGAETPVPVAKGAALGATGQGSLAVAPTGDLIAFVRTDGSLVTLAVNGGEERVLATDVWMPSVGAPSSLSWDPVGGQIAYLATGTQDMVEPRSEEPRLPSVNGAHTKPLPEGVLGAVVKLVDRDGKVTNRLGDPSTRSMSGVTYSSTDDMLLLESVAPDTQKPYSLATASSSVPDVSGTPLSADDPAFSPDGNFILAVGPRVGENELIRISTEEFSRAVIAIDKDICHPSVSPDGTRIAYGAGKGCSRLKLISSLGGTPIDITPSGRPGLTFDVTRVQWTQEGHFVAFPDCRRNGDATTCSGRVTFLDPDRSLIINGPSATTVSTVARPLSKDMTVHVAMQGPIDYEGSFLVDSQAEAVLTDVSQTGSLIDIVLKDGERKLGIKLDVDTQRRFVSGTLNVVDPPAGINRTFVITASASLIGMRVASVSGIWFSTTDMPFASGEFRLSVLRGQ